MYRLTHINFIRVFAGWSLFILYASTRDSAVSPLTFIGMRAITVTNVGLASNNIDIHLCMHVLIDSTLIWMFIKYAIVFFLSLLTASNGTLRHQHRTHMRQCGAVAQLQQQQQRWWRAAQQMRRCARPEIFVRRCVDGLTRLSGSQ